MLAAMFCIGERFEEGSAPSGGGEIANIASFALGGGLVKQRGVLFIEDNETHVVVLGNVGCFGFGFIKTYQIKVVLFHSGEGRFKLALGVEVISLCSEAV